MDSVESLLLEVLSGKGAKYKVLKIIGEKGEVDRSEIAEIMNITPQAAGKILSELNNESILLFRSYGNRKVYSLSPIGWAVYEGLMTAKVVVKKRISEDKARWYLDMRMRDVEGRIRLLERKLEKVKNPKRRRLIIREIERCRKELRRLEAMARRT